VPTTSVSAKNGATSEASGVGPFFPAGAVATDKGAMPAQIRYSWLPRTESCIM